MKSIEMDFECRKPVYRYRCSQCGTCDRFEIFLELNICLKYGKIARSKKSTKEKLDKIGDYYSRPSKCMAYFDDLIDGYLSLIRCEECDKVIEDEEICDQIYNDVAKIVSLAETKVLI